MTRKVKYGGLPGKRVIPYITSTPPAELQDEYAQYVARHHRPSLKSTHPRLTPAERQLQAPAQRHVEDIRLPPLSPAAVAAAAAAAAAEQPGGHGESRKRNRKSNKKRKSKKSKKSKRKSKKRKSKRRKTRRH